MFFEAGMSTTGPPDVGHHLAPSADESGSVGLVPRNPGPLSGAIPKNAKSVSGAGCGQEDPGPSLAPDNPVTREEQPVAVDGVALSSQAAEDQVAIINEMCKHVENVMRAFDSQDVQQLPSEASKALSQLKGKMVLFAGRTPLLGVKDSTRHGHSSEGSGLSGSGSDGESSVCSQPPAKVVPKIENGVSSFANGSGQLVSLKNLNLTLEERLIGALERLDLRRVPAPEPYDRSSGQSFSAFLVLFEDYCRHSFKGSESLWVAELGRFLTGDMYRAFNAHKSPDDSYLVVKTKLLKWYSESKSRREAGSKAMFTRASMRVDESVRLYAARLENLFRSAFPGGKVESSKTLLEKFLKSIPRKYRKQIKSALSWGEAFSGKSLGWSQVVKLVGGLEEALASDKSSDDEESAFEVMRSVARPISVNKREASTQCNSAGEVLMPQTHSEQQQVLSREQSGSRFQPVGFGERERQLTAVCHFCGKLGHMQRDCRRKHGLCLVCGSRDHQVAECPRRFSERQGNYSSPERSRQGDGSRTGEARRRVSFGEVQTGDESDSLNWSRPAWRGSLRS